MSNKLNKQAIESPIIINDNVTRTAIEYNSPLTPVAIPYVITGTIKNTAKNKGTPKKLLMYFIQKIYFVLIGNVKRCSKSVVEYISLNTWGTPIKIIIPTINRYP